MADQWWYYSCNGHQLGPVSLTALRDMAAEGQLKPTDLVWQEGMSQWAPASATRGLFPTAVLEPAPAPAMAGAAIPAALPASASPPPPGMRPPKQPGRYDDEDLSDLRPGRIRRQSGSGGKAILIAGITFGVIAMLVIGGIAAALIITGIKGQQQNSYTAKLNSKDDRSSRMVHFNQGDNVHITVVTTQWGGGPHPDVDLFIYTPDGQLWDLDDSPEKDCDVRFVAPQTGLYKIELHLFDGNWAQCTVRH